MAVPRDRQSGDDTLLESLTETDSDGRYQLGLITPGRYYIVAGALVAPTYYPGTTNAGAATVLNIEPGSSATAVNFTIPRIPTPAPTLFSLVVPPATGRVVLEKEYNRWLLYLQ